ncbi:nucleoside recognition domain-containing protein [Antarctobacter sp.]|uniref:nucleoside recognition domain-containing protein n=1 Tax=Antarctobacter sp. TaxID=1872577 RepID=UPI003A930F9E
MRGLLKWFGDVNATFLSLAKVIVPVSIAVELLSRWGLIEEIAPFLRPLMSIFGLPPEMGLVWLTGLFTSMWGAVAILFTVVPADTLTVADVTVFSGLLLMAHALPLEQSVIRSVGPGFVVTALIRIVGAMLFAGLLRLIFDLTGWLAEPIQPTLSQEVFSVGEDGFWVGLVKMLFKIYVILAILIYGLQLMEKSGAAQIFQRFAAPLLKLAGLKNEAVEVTSIGLIIGIAFGSGLLKRSATRGQISSRQLWLSCIFLGFAHALVEDTLLMVALGADFTTVFFGRLAFAIVCTAVIAAGLRLVLDRKSQKCPGVSTD